ncbi:MAG: hypothetical protein A2Z83_00350 [Omnitrophica bacterium GWA2_52_8]|nr:MAG: hypothetical protein A2Z83_00350 [Omnitrophica bacterium GWA2_52_8]
MQQESPFGKNYWLALGISMLILLAWQPLLKMTGYAPAPAPPAVTQESVREVSAGEEMPAPAKSTPALSAAEGPFLEAVKKAAVVQFRNEFYDIKFSTQGASVVQLRYIGSDLRGNVSGAEFFDEDISKPGLFAVDLGPEAPDLSRAVYNLTRSGQNDSALEFTYEMPSAFKVTKKFIFSATEPVIVLDVSVTNLSNAGKSFPAAIHIGMDDRPDEEEKGMFRSFDAVFWGDGIQARPSGKIRSKGLYIVQPLVWSGIVKKYFALLVKPDKKISAVSGEADQASIFLRLTSEVFETVPGGTAKAGFLIYAGPQRYEALKKTGAGFEEIISLNPGLFGQFKGLVGLFKLWMLQGLKFGYQFTHNFGWAIILLTLLIKGLFAPFTHMSYESMKRMQAIQPKMKSLQERYKNDVGKLHREMAQLYKRNKVNPWMGCLPMLLQMPIFIGFYFMLADCIELKGAPFIFWIHDLSRPDHLWTLPFSLPLLGNGINLLPLLMIFSMVWQQKLTPTAAASPEQEKIMAFMPVMMGFVFYKMPSGLVLYWLVSTLLTVIQQVFVKRIVIVLHHEDRE